MKELISKVDEVLDKNVEALQRMAKSWAIEFAQGSIYAEAVFRRGLIATYGAGANSAFDASLEALDLPTPPVQEVMGEGE